MPWFYEIVGLFSIVCYAYASAVLIWKCIFDCKRFWYFSKLKFSQLIVCLKTLSLPVNNNYLHFLSLSLPKFIERQLSTFIHTPKNEFLLQ